MLRLLSLALIATIGMIIAAAMLLPRTGKADPAQAPALAQGASKGPSASNVEDTEIARDPSGKFRLNAIVNGQDAGFLLDTGADTVALSIEDAERFGVEVNRDAFEPIAQTASGSAMGAHITIETIEIAGQEFRDVEAIVIDGLTDNLLGQSLLRKLGKMEVQGDKMVIRRS